MEVPSNRGLHITEEFLATHNLQVPLNHIEDSGYLSGSLSSNQCSISSDEGGETAITSFHNDISPVVNVAHLPCLLAEVIDANNGMDVDDPVPRSNTPGIQSDSSCDPPPYTCESVWQSTPAVEGDAVDVQQEFQFATPLPASGRRVPQASVPGTLYYLCLSSDVRKSRVGQSHVDILSCLAEPEYGPPLEKILNYLEPLDLCQVRLVSKSWRKVLHSSSHVKQWRNFVRTRRQNKENSKATVVKPEEELDALFSPISSRSQLREIHNMVKSKKQPTRSPPVSPSKMHSSRYVKEGQKLRRGQKLLKCPKCEWPSRCEPNRAAARCTGLQCQFYFCTDCSSPFHENSSCPKATPVTPTRTRNRVIKMGSKISKSNLRRLLL